MTNHEGQLPNDAGEQSREAAVQAQSVPAEPAQSDSARPDSARADSARADSARADSARADSARSESQATTPNAVSAEGSSSSGVGSVSTGAVGSAAAEGRVVSAGTGIGTGAGTAHATGKVPSKRKRESEPAEIQVTSNNVRRIRIELMLSKAEVARRANISVLTLDRVERGYGCRVDTKRKILEALGLSLADRIRVFGEEE